MTSDNGFSVSEANNGLVHINLHLSGKSTNPANISFEINKTHNVTVLLQSTDGPDIKLVSKNSLSMKNDNNKLSAISKIHKRKCKFKAEQRGPLKGRGMIRCLGGVIIIC